MKNNFVIILITILLTGGITFLATKNFYDKPGNYKNEHRTTLLPPGNFNPSPNSHAYSIDSARMDIDTLQGVATLVNNKLGGQLPPHMGRGVVGYTISSFDLLGALGVPDGAIVPPYEYVRVYMGFDDSTGFRMFVVTVDSANGVDGNCCGRDLFYDIDAKGSLHVNPVPGSGKFVLDLIAPCPTTCDTSSLLVQDIQNQVGCKCDKPSRNQGYKK